MTARSLRTQRGIRTVAGSMACAFIASRTVATSHHNLGGRGSIDIVDAQLHLSLELGVDEIVASMDALGIRSVVLDEIWGRNEQGHSTPCVEFGGGAYRPLSPYAQAAALRHPDRFSFQQRVRRHDPQLAALMAVLGSSPGCRAVRVVLFEPAERAAFIAGEYDELLGLASAHALPICVCAVDMGTLLPAATSRFPDLQFVIDHCGWTKGEAQWNDVLALAHRPNAWLKWSHAARAFGRRGDATQKTRLALRQALDAFGAQRVLWAGDVTHEESNASWSTLLSVVQNDDTLSSADLEWVLGKTARRLFRWPPPISVDAGSAG